MSETIGSGDRPVVVVLADVAAVGDPHLRLLTGLAEAIRENGWSRTQLGDIVRHARASRATFYKHFADKDSCFEELVRLLSVQWREDVAAAIDPAAEWTTQIGQLVDRYLAQIVADPALATTLSSPALADGIVRAQRDAMEAYARLFVDLSRSARFRASGIAELPLELAYLLASGIHHTVIRALERGDDVAALADGLKRALRVHFGAGAG
jgi:AcrR family transcriptional regulator